MSRNSAIEWCDDTWNPVTGCTEVSPGCDHCYAKTFAERWRGTSGHYFERGFDVQLRPDKLDQPLRWRKPRKIFVNSMSDLFHDSVPDEYIARVWAIMALSPRHTYQLLTKRHGRMRSLVGSERFAGRVYKAVNDVLAQGDPPRIAEDIIVAALDGFCRGNFAVLPNVWGMVSAEDQQRADLRIPALLDTPFAVRGVSAEPLLGPMDLLGDAENPGPAIIRTGVQTRPNTPDGPAEYDYDDQVGIDWVIVGGESGPGARPMHPDWARSLRDQCQEADVAFLFKQWGEWSTDFYRGTHLLQTTGQLITRASGTTTNPYGYGSGVQDLVDRGHPGWVRVRRAGKRAAGRQLDGRTWDQYPEVDANV